MKRFSAREFALLCVPVAVVAGAGWWASRRPAPLVPHIEACDLRPATAWETFNGADMKFTARAIQPHKGKGRLMAEVSNEKGQIWHTGEGGGWQKFSRAGTGINRETNDGTGDVQELINGINAQQIFNGGATLTAKISLANVEGVPFNAYASAPVVASKTYVLRSSDVVRVAVSERRKANFKVIGATLGPEKWENGVTRPERFIHLEIQMLDGSAVRDFQSTGQWELYINGKRNLYLSLFPWDSLPRPTAKGTTMLTMKGREDADYSDGIGVFCEARGLLSINDGWPLEVALQLPKGVNARNVKQRFVVKTRLAPLPPNAARKS